MDLVLARQPGQRGIARVACGGFDALAGGRLYLHARFI